MNYCLLMVCIFSLLIYSMNMKYLLYIILVELTSSEFRLKFTFNKYGNMDCVKKHPNPLIFTKIIFLEDLKISITKIPNFLKLKILYSSKLYCQTSLFGVVLDFLNHGCSDAWYTRDKPHSDRLLFFSKNLIY